MDVSSSEAAQAHAVRMTREFRTILESSRQALAEVRSDRYKTVLVKLRIAERLDALEQRLLNNGRDPTLLVGIKRAREELLA